MDIEQALNRFRSYIEGYRDQEKALCAANGANFDSVSVKTAVLFTDKSGNSDVDVQVLWSKIAKR